MNRIIVIDTETTGLDPDDGHRVVEIGALELINGQKNTALCTSNTLTPSEQCRRVRRQSTA
jgi:DNA polymerase III epsilon subunit-like protein